MNREADLWGEWGMADYHLHKLERACEIIEMIASEKGKSKDFETTLNVLRREIGGLKKKSNEAKDELFALHRARWLHDVKELFNDDEIKTIMELTEKYLKQPVRSMGTSYVHRNVRDALEDLRKGQINQNLLRTLASAVKAGNMDDYEKIRPALERAIKKIDEEDS